VRTLRSYLDARVPFPVLVTVVDNGSADGTWEAASRLAAQVPGVRAVHLAEKGRGRALKAAWLASDSPVLAYMDVDLSTDLDAILPLVAPLISGHSDLAIGSRLAPGARVVRGAKREAISRAYNLMVRTMTRNRFSDAQCGFKAIRADAAHVLLPHVRDDEWFFDTELLVLAERNGLRIHEVPVDWVDDPDSRVNVIRTATSDLRGLLRVTAEWITGRGRLDVSALSGRTLLPASRLVRIGGISTFAYLVLFLLLQLCLPRVGAATLALTVTAAGNAAAYWQNVRDEHQRIGLLRLSAWAWAAGLVLTSMALWAADWASGSLLAAVVALLAANVVVSAGKLLAIRQMPL
jgi:glycosyltransferase involved in cell wall biosynthesis